MKAIFILVVLPIHVAFSQLKIIPTLSNQQWMHYDKTAQITKKIALQSDKQKYFLPTLL